MLFDKITPEEAGISSDAIREFIEILEESGSATHSVIMMKGEKIFAEYYWKPFASDKNHRQYSQTKSFVSLAIGLLEGEGKLSLDDKLVKFFPEKIDGALPEFLADQTIREMLTMTTIGQMPYWFTDEDKDRTHIYLNRNFGSRPSGTVWDYDSNGSQVMGALVEKLTGMKLLDYLKEKIFNKMGTFKNAEILRCGNGDSWADSALLATARDMASAMLFVMKDGNWNGEQLLDREYIKAATSKQRDNSEHGINEAFSHGYGYQIWLCENGFLFNGMGDQFTICIPEKELIFAINCDNQGFLYHRQIYLSYFFRNIARKMQNTPLPENKEAEKRLFDVTKDLKLLTARGTKHADIEKKVSGKEYICRNNPMGITKFTLDFNENGGEFKYTNAQGDKVIHFGLCENVFEKFPQLGYSDDFGGLETTNGFMYDDAVSGAWLDENKFHIRVQIIDRYLGNVTFFISFKDKYAHLTMAGVGENFLREYQGSAVGETK